MQWNSLLDEEDVLPLQGPPHRRRCPALGDGACRWQEPHLHVYCSGNARTDLILKSLSKFGEHLT